MIHRHSKIARYPSATRAPYRSIGSRPFAAFADAVLHLHQLAPTCINLRLKKFPE
jgi:hypothetical protein